MKGYTMNTYTLVFDDNYLRKTGANIKVIKADNLLKAYYKACAQHNDYLEGVPCYYGGFNFNNAPEHWHN